MNFNSKKILIIDDDKTLLDILSQLFDRLGCEPICASSGDVGLNLFMKKRPEVVLTDFDMPGMDGTSPITSKPYTRTRWSSSCRDTIGRAY